MTALTPAQLAEAEALILALWDDWPWRTRLVDDTIVIDADGKEVCRVSGDYHDRDVTPYMEARAAFIAASRSLVPALISTARLSEGRAVAAEAEVERLKLLERGSIDACNRALECLERNDTGAARDAIIGHSTRYTAALSAAEPKG